MPTDRSLGLRLSGTRPVATLTEDGIVKNVMPLAIAGETGVAYYKTRTHFEDAIPDPDTYRVEIGGYYSENDGGAATYKRVASEPSHAGKVQSADGAWWEINVEWPTPQMFGAAADGTSDDTTAVQSAIDFVASRPYAGAVWFPTGRYKITGTITVKEGVHLKGPGVFDPDEPGNVGSTFYVTHTGSEAFLFNDGSGFEGLAFYYPGQVTTSPPIAYDWLFKANVATENVQGNRFNNLYIYNAYNAFYLASETTNITGNIIVSNIRMCALNKAFYVGNASTAHFFSDVDNTIAYWPDSQSSPVRDWMNKNAIGWHIYQGTGVQAVNCNHFGVNIGVLNDGGNVTFLILTQVIFDGTDTPIKITGSGALQGVHFDNCRFAPKQPTDATADNCYGLYIDTTSSSKMKINYSNCRFAPGSGGHVYIVDNTSGAGEAMVSFDNCFFEYPNVNGLSNKSAYSCVYTNHPGLTMKITDCEFRTYQTDAYCIDINDVDNAIIVDNAFWGRPDTQVRVAAAQGDVIITGNWSRNTQGSSSVSISGVTGELVYRNNIWDKPPSVVYGTRPAVLVTHGTATSTSADNVLTVPWDTEVFDRSGSWDAASHTFTAPLSGVYSVSLGITHDNSVTVGDRFRIRIVTSNRTFASSYLVESVPFQTVSKSVVVDMEKDDTLSVEINRVAASGGAWTFLNNAQYNWLSIQLVE